MKAFASLLVGLFVVTSVQGASTITQWTFNSGTDSSTSTGTLTPYIGSGTVVTIGGVTSTYATGSSSDTDPLSDGNSALNTATFQAQSTGSGTAGVQFMVSTVGFEDIILSFDHRASGTASRWAQLDYTLDGGTNWVTGFWNNAGGISPDSSFYNFSVDLSSIAGADDNALFGVRIVSIFSPNAFTENDNNSYGADAAYQRSSATTTGSGTYGTSGTWRFDLVTFSGNVAAVPEPSRMLLLSLGSFGFLIRRRRA